MTRRHRPMPGATPDQPPPPHGRSELTAESAGAPTPNPRGRARLDRAGARLTARDRALLGLVGRHPFLPAADLARIGRRPGGRATPAEDGAAAGQSPDAPKQPRTWYRHAVAAADEETARRDAERLAHLPPHTPERVLLLVAQLPALTPGVLAFLAYDEQHRAPPRADRLLDGLERDGLVRPLPVLGPGGSTPRCVLLTEHGTAELARALGTEPETLSARYGLDYPSLGVRIGWVPETLPRYGMLAGLASCDEDAPLLLGWRRYWPPDSERELDVVDPLRWALPACARLQLHGRVAEYLLLADQTEDPIGGLRGAPAVRPVGFYEPVIRRVLAHHATMDRPPPRLLVATDTEERALAWRAMVEAMDEVLPRAPLGMTVATWEGLPAALLTVLARELFGVRVVFRREAP